jgi:hypothetical protein
MQSYSRKTIATAGDGRRVLISTVRHPVVVETAIFPVDATGKVTSAMHLFKQKHDEEDLDQAHEQLVAAVESGEVELVERDATPEEAQEALGELILLRKMTDDQSMNDETPSV